MIPGSALRKLSAITGLEASKEDEGCYRLSIAPGVAFFAFIKDEKEACEQLRKDNWRRVCLLKFESVGWKCERCTKMTGLTGHHKIYRSRWRRQDGPLDVVSNIEALCSSCHDGEHRGA